eukprot:gnl/Dysnectes_brevis/963_a1073_1596.p1 GENE.gnl/Dysnectes_brevis/963_a1073_1596~~gnl/Dysnectes_brevis/963_a1073_1596.p1  ORF type:complete len:399 (+),score=65.57 gnl/Dysnectes_brevis/963_a1073_1596:2-1198(+)
MSQDLETHISTDSPCDGDIGFMDDWDDRVNEEFFELTVSNIDTAATEFTSLYHAHEIHQLEVGTQLNLIKNAVSLHKFDSEQAIELINSLHDHIASASPIQCAFAASLYGIISLDLADDIKNDIIENLAVALDAFATISSLIPFCSAIMAIASIAGHRDPVVEATQTAGIPRHRVSALRALLRSIVEVTTTPNHIAVQDFAAVLAANAASDLMTSWVVELLPSVCDVTILVGVFSDIFYVLRAYVEGKVHRTAAACILRGIRSDPILSSFLRAPNFLKEAISFTASVLLTLEAPTVIRSAARGFLTALMLTDRLLDPEDVRAGREAVLSTLGQPSDHPQAASALRALCHAAFDNYVRALSIPPHAAGTLKLTSLDLTPRVMYPASPSGRRTKAALPGF